MNRYLIKDEKHLPKGPNTNFVPHNADDSLNEPKSINSTVIPPQAGSTELADNIDTTPPPPEMVCDKGEDCGDTSKLQQIQKSQPLGTRILPYTQNTVIHMTRHKKLL